MPGVTISKIFPVIARIIAKGGVLKKKTCELLESIAVMLAKSMLLVIVVTFRWLIYPLDVGTTSPYERVQQSYKLDLP